MDAVKLRRLYLEEATRVEMQVRNGHINAGKQLPSERDLAARFDVSCSTIRNSLDCP